MSITVKVGKPGSGKTLVSLMLYIFPALLAGRVVYHNIPGLNHVKIAYYLRNKYNRSDITPYYVHSLLHDYSNEYLLENWKEIFPVKTPVPVVKTSARTVARKLSSSEKLIPPTEDDLGAYYLNAIPKAPQGSLIVLDEAQKKCYINSKNWREERNRKFFEYCSIHRKSKHEVLIITQDDDNIDSSVNGIREELIFLLRMERLGFFFRNKVRLNYYLGHQTIKNTPYARMTVSYDKSVFGLYESYAPGLLGKGNVKEVRKTKNVLLNPKLIVFFSIGLFLFLYSAPNFIGMMQGKGLTKKMRQASLSSSSSFSLGEYEEYYCGEKFYILRPGGIVDSLEPKNVPPSYCPRMNFNFKRGVK